jgi:uncharacterized RDD family membrane protein YckC
MFCPNCGKANDDNAKFCQVCGVSLQSKTAAAVPAGAAAIPVAAGSGTYAGFGTRLLAFIIDCLILALATGAVTAGTLGVGVVLSFFAPWLYEAFMLSSEWQATVGKRAMSIVVTGMDGGRISFARATGRHFAKYLSAFLLFVGFIMAAFTARKQALHDMIAETLVVNR